MADELDPTKYHVLTPQKKRILIAGLLVFFLLIVPSISYLYYKVAINRPSQGGKEVEFNISTGDSIFEIAGSLGDKGAINSPFLFVLNVFLTNSQLNIQAGNYKIKAGATLAEVVDMLKHGTNDVTVTFVEGWRNEEFARLAANSLDKVDYKGFLNEAKGLEGFLFPDTYFINRDVQEKDLVDLLKNTFDKKTQNILTPENIAKTGLSKNQIVTLASLVEREVSNETDRATVAGILLKRLHENMKLDVDASVQYAAVLNRLCKGDGYCIPTLEDYMKMNWWPTNLTKDELNIDSPYNTRKNVGLPPAPISSVSLSSLNAVISPKDSPYYFYLTGKDGITHYAKTLQEHNENIAKYL